MRATPRMPIERGEDWGWPATGDGAVPICASDAELAAAISQGTKVVRVSGGDMARTLGLADHGNMQAAPTWHAPLDALRVWLDDQAPVIAAAHVRIGTWKSRAGWQAIMNAAFDGKHNLAPRAHPGDGFADLVTCTVQGTERLQAMRRAATGTHVPHPQISIRRTKTETIELSRRRSVRLDGRRAGRVQQLRIEVIPNAIVVAI